MALNSVMIDLQGDSISPRELQWLQNPLVGGVILFSRNFTSMQQITDLVSAIHKVRSPKLLVAIDHEGGRVQRFRQGFTAIPAAAKLGEVYATDHSRGRRLAEMSGWVMALELRAIGIDFSFAPVLDLDRGISSVIGDRAYATTPEAVADLGFHVMKGMKRAGMATVGKHFPGHGGVEADSHLTLPVDERSLATIRNEDLQPFARLIESGLDGIMPAHVLYPAVDSQPAGFSRFWLQQILRKELQFAGAIFSDDLSMEGAVGVGSVTERAKLALQAGCDMVLVCNQPDTVSQLLRELPDEVDPVHNAHLIRLHGRHHVTWQQLRYNQEWQQAVHALGQINQPQQNSLL